MIPAYRIETERCTLRCFDPSDARALHELVLSNREHLARWLEWARDEPISLAERVEVLRKLRHRFDGDLDQTYGVFDRAGLGLIGAVGLHPVALEPGSATIGYWLARAHCGRGFATEAASALVRCAFELEGKGRVEIHCDASNAASRKLALRLGFHLDAELRERGHAPGEPRAVFSMLAREFRTSSAARSNCSAFDALGDPILAPFEGGRSAPR